MSLPPYIPPALRQLMADVGPRWKDDISGHIRLMLDNFSALLKDAPKEGVEVRREIKYGVDPRQAYDLFLPQAAGTGRPAMLFVHGGAFTEGHRNRTDEIYANVLYYLARHGIVGVNIGYRIAPQACYPEASRDIGEVVQAIHNSAPEIGVDPQRIFLMGHSAGGAHVATYAYDRSLHPVAGSGLAGLVIVSGRVRAENRPENPNARRVETYYETTDPGTLDRLSPVSQVDAQSIPTFIAWGEYENPLIDVHCAELVHWLAQAKGYTPPTMWLRGHNHTSTIAHLNTSEDNLGSALRDFINRPR
ncbi:MULTISPECIES: alpha/beta hydrolase [unclassified Beijerinckia]|uniref:alpha/beta hydrolase n=1 Tax=unclassified Beijerinckia TaxID=2638183 RepID=UPI00089A14AF|nr:MULTISPECIES: alpha/beta hydrolase [unclassified Beijerinckia]MDH7799244.1 acetyl esterase [Beijerinckia sp. GAS462]SED90895.1 Acetyl esterase/lipase [Beijerinckia sp. 28-YEA-48]